MATYGGMKSRILNELNRQDLTDEASAAMQTAISYFETRRFWFNEARATQNTASDQEFYGLPSDYISSDSLILRQSSLQYPLIQVSWDEIEDFQRSNPPRTGRPTHFALYADQIRLYPTPDTTAYTLVISYIRRLPELVDDGDSNEWTLLAEGLIRNHAEKDIAALVLHDPDLAAVYNAFAAEELKRLNKQTASHLFKGTPKRYDFPTFRHY